MLFRSPSETSVGDGIRRAGIARDDILVTTKVSHEYLRADDFARSVDESLARLQLDYVDYLLVHWPSTEGIPLAETMGALAKAKREGKARHIGVANFNIALTEDAMRLCPEPLAVLQARIGAAYHPMTILRNWWRGRAARKKAAKQQGDSVSSAASNGYPIFPLRTLTEIDRLMRHVSARLYKVTAPTIVLQAREDDMTSPHNAYLVHEGISSQHKQVMLLDDCYHVITVDRQKQAVVDRKSTRLNSSHRT